MSEAATQESGRRGRPRPQEVIQRDERVLKAIVDAGPDGRTRAQLAEALQLAPTEVYLSLYRLRVAKKVNRDRTGGAHVWKAA